ncbi:MAG: hypothetical protein Q8N85_01790 [Candidatus Omnitrophota bacterium]|nr:hypothetical protein [Candidatus Omnitrophota bacterium]
MDIHKIKNLYWEQNYNIREIAEKLGISFWPLYNFINKNSLPLRSPSQVNYVTNKNKPQFTINENLDIEMEKLRLAGMMLYWAEGTFKGSTVDFVNSNPQIIKIFLRFLREICGVSEERLRVYLYGYHYQDLRKLKNYWHKVTNISISQFTKPYIKKGNLNLNDRELPYGLVHIRYNDKRLLELIRSWITEYTIWAGTQAAKGDRLCKRSVLSKGRMEK